MFFSLISLLHPFLLPTPSSLPNDSQREKRFSLSQTVTYFRMICNAVKCFDKLTSTQSKLLVCENVATLNESVYLNECNLNFYLNRKQNISLFNIRIRKWFQKYLCTSALTYKKRVMVFNTQEKCLYLTNVGTRVQFFENILNTKSIHQKY